jgi:hypothetical protein
MLTGLAVQLVASVLDPSYVAVSRYDPALGYEVE